MSEPAMHPADEQAACRYARICIPSRLEWRPVLFEAALLFDVVPFVLEARKAEGGSEQIVKVAALEGGDPGEALAWLARQGAAVQDIDPEEHMHYV